VILAALLAASLATADPTSTPTPADLATAPAPLPTGQPAPAITYEDAVRLARAGRTDEALAAFRALVARNPDDFDSAVYVGRLLVRQGRVQEAVTIYADVIARSPRNADARVALAGALINLGRVDDAWAAVQDAEALAPRSGDVQAVKGRVLRRLGRPSEALTALNLAHELSPEDDDVAIVRERTARLVAHRAHVSVAREASGDGIPEASIVDADVDLRVDDDVRVNGRVQWQTRAGESDTRAGLGAEFRLSRRVLARGAFMASPGSPRVARADVAGELELAAGRTQPALGVRYLHFADARVWIIAPSIAVDVTDNVALAVRYYRSESEFLASGQRAGNDSYALMGRWQAARRVGFSGAYARGNESFDILSIDRLGRFRADTLAGGIRLDLKSLTSVAVGVERQWRTGDRQLTRITFDLVQHF
jgi:YaiO family outer membrane protein